jgi:hypothetical protein
MSYLRVTSMALEMRRFAAEVFGRTMLIRGQVDSTRRLTDLVNEGDPYLRLSEVSTYPYAARKAPALDRHQRGLVSKNSIVMLAELEPVAVPGATASSGMRIPKKPHRILAYIDDFVLSADIHLTEGADMATFLTMSQGQFVPMTNATVGPTDPDSGLTNFERPFLLINREHIVYLGGDH